MFTAGAIRSGQPDDGVLDRLVAQRNQLEQASNEAFSPIVPTALGAAAGVSGGVIAGTVVGGAIGALAEFAQAFSGDVSSNAIGRYSRNVAIAGALTCGVIAAGATYISARHEHEQSVRQARESLALVNDTLAELRR